MAQTPGSFVGRNTNPNAPPLAAAALNAAFGTKADAANGVLTNPTITGGTLDNAPVGGSIPSTGAFTMLSVGGALSGAGLAALFASPPSIGNSVPNTGAFTTLSATGAVSGAGITALFASPPAIGGTTPSTGRFTSFNGWPATFAAQNGSVVVTGGTGYVIGEVMTLADGCATHTTLVASTVAGSVISRANIGNPGICTISPSGTLTVASTTGTGTGATFTIPYAPTGPNAYTGDFIHNAGNTALGAEQSGYYAGQESIFIGNRAGGTISTGDFITVVGHNACGVGAGATPITGASSMICIGTDAGRNIAQGVARNVLIGPAAGQNVAATDNTIVGNGAASTLLVGGVQNTILGGGAATTLVSGGGNFIGGFKADVTVATAINAVIIGAQNAGGAAGARCPGESVCVGAAIGNASVTSAGGQHVLIGSRVGQTNLTNGTGEILIGYNLDMPTGQGFANGWRNIGGSWIAKQTAPTVLSGFGTSPTVAGNGTAGFTVNVGTGGTASSGVLTISSTAAPTGWACNAVDQTNAATANTVATPLSTTTITLTNYSRTTGIATAWAASDVITVSCNGY